MYLQPQKNDIVTTRNKVTLVAVNLFNIKNLEWVYHVNKKRGMMHVTKTIKSKDLIM